MSHAALYDGRVGMGLGRCHELHQEDVTRVEISEKTIKILEKRGKSQEKSRKSHQKLHQRPSISAPRKAVRRRWQKAVDLLDSMRQEGIVGLLGALRQEFFSMKM